ncbi:MAG: tRNA (N(6)-L-threonylcarbamoyladenosine(37)-C(2))-methylthiotransferase MtaB [Armatimonadetes bacterium]|nr:tRNA (N(6)-L-threonylcarbamoyladenosine(37)-C(2))-methylthiotransferase MtaB [Armatimonadota bacterium]
MPTAAFTTLGCKVNQYETQRILASFEERGFDIVPFDQPADIYVINSCSVTQQAEAKSRQTVRRAARANPEAKVVLTGCYGQFALIRGESLPEASLVVPNPEKLKTLDRVLAEYPQLAENLQAREEPLYRTPSRHRAVLKVQDGCSVHCAFCSIPFTRPVMQSLPFAELLEEARQMAALGYKELVLTGVLIGDYGPHNGSSGPDLTGLIRLLAEIPGIERIRISSIEPTLITEELIDLIAENPKLCPHLHIPLQSGDTGVLGRMNRPYDQPFYLELCSRLRRRIPDFSISTDIMVGFPGEDEAAFQNTIRVVEEAQFCRTHAFRFSPRPGTPAADMADSVQDSVKEERSKRLIAQSREAAQRYNARFLGREERLLVETRSKRSGLLSGTSDHYLQIEAPGADAYLGRSAMAVIRETSADGCVGEIVSLV